MEFKKKKKSLVLLMSQYVMNTRNQTGNFDSVEQLYISFSEVSSYCSNYITVLLFP